MWAKKGRARVQRRAIPGQPTLGWAELRRAAALGLVRVNQHEAGLGCGDLMGIYNKGVGVVATPMGFYLGILIQWSAP